MGTFIDQALTMDRNTWFLLLMLVVGAYVIMMYQFNGHTEALMAAPFLYLGGAAGRQIFTLFNIQVAEPGINTLVGLSAGVITTAILLITIKWTAAALRE